MTSVGAGTGSYVTALSREVHHLSLRDKAKAPATTGSTASWPLGETAGAGSSSRGAAAVRVWEHAKIIDAHYDDIHGLIQLSDSTIISGSKDGNLHRWSADGDQLPHVQTRNTVDYRNWITALCPTSELGWASGSRDGTVQLWSAGSRAAGSWKLPVLNNSHCKERNNNRVNCLCADESRQHLYVGRPTTISKLDASTGTSLGQQAVSKNDWVYCIDPVTDRSVLVVTGCRMDIWKEKGSSKAANSRTTSSTSSSISWAHQRSLVSNSPPLPGTTQRPFISSVRHLSSDPAHRAFTVFDGTVRTIDIERGVQLRKFTGHKGRVWCVVEAFSNISAVLASGADDGTVRFWDNRAAKGEVKCINMKAGRVSNMMQLKNGSMLVATCPDRPSSRVGCGAVLRIWQVRD